MSEVWLPEPPRGTEVCGGFDGSELDDTTVIRLETKNGFIFTPRYGPDKRPTIWDPKHWGGKIPRDEIHAAWDELNRRFKLVRVYCDPGFRDESSWASEIDDWGQLYGEKVFVPWRMDGNSRVEAVYQMLRRFEADLEHGQITHDGCPITATHMGNARRIAKTMERYGLGKPSQGQKIDAAVTTALAHEAACDARQQGWRSKIVPKLVTASSSRRLRR